jgi:hypothetical protein
LKVCNVSLNGAAAGFRSDIARGGSYCRGQYPFKSDLLLFLPAADKRKVELVEKYKELKAAGKLDSFLAKRRKKNAAKDHRFIPYRRQGVEGDS